MKVRESLKLEKVQTPAVLFVPMAWELVKGQWSSTGWGEGVSLLRESQTEGSGSLMDLGRGVRGKGW